MATRKTTKKTKLTPLPSPSVVDAAPDESEADSATLLERIARLERDYQSRVELDELLERLYDMKRPARKEEGEEIVISSKPMDTIHLASDLIATNTPLIDVPPASERQADLDEAELAEKFAGAVWHTWARASAEPILYQEAWYANLLGRFCHRVTYVEPDASGLPVRLEIRNPKYVYPLFDADRRVWAVVERYELTAGDLRRMGIPDKTDDVGEKRDDDERVQYACWWDAKRCVIFVDGAEVYRELHGYERLPYVYGYGRFRPGEDAAKRAVSLLQGMLYTAPALDLAMSAKITGALAAIFSAFIHESDRPDGLKKEDLKSGEVVPLFTGEKLYALHDQDLPASLDSAINDLKEELNNTGFRTLAGQGDNSSGFAFNQLSRGEKLRINPVKQALDRAWSETFELVFDIIAKSGKTVELPVPRTAGVNDRGYSGMVKMTPAMARKVKTVNVSIPPDTLQDMTQNVSMALQTTSGANPLLDHSTARRRFLNETDDAGIDLRIMEQKMRELAVPVWFQQFVLPLLGLAQQMQGQAQGGGNGSMPPNAGMPVTTPANQPFAPDSLAGVPPQGEPDALAQGAQAVMGQGIDPAQAQQLAMSQGTPQAAGRGR